MKVGDRVILTSWWHPKYNDYIRNKVPAVILKITAAGQANIRFEDGLVLRPMIDRLKLISPRTNQEALSFLQKGDI